MPDRRRERGSIANDTVGARAAVVGAWQRLGRGWQAVVLGLAIVCSHLLVQTL